MSSNPAGIMSRVSANHLFVNILSPPHHPATRLVSNYYLKWIAGISVPAVSEAGNHNKTIGQLWTSLSLIRMSQWPSRLSDGSCALDTDTHRERGEGSNNLWPCMLMRPSVASGSLMKSGWTPPLSALLSDTSA